MVTISRFLATTTSASEASWSDSCPVADSNGDGWKRVRTLEQYSKPLHKELFFDHLRAYDIRV